MSQDTHTIFQNFESPLFTSYHDNRPKSPPPDKIIRACNLHPRTMGQSDSTKKLCYAPNVKTMQCKRKSIQKDEDLISEDPIYFRFLRLLSNYELIISKPETGDSVNVIVEGMISSIDRLNQMFRISPKLKMTNINTKFDFTERKNINVLNYYNSFSSLVSFDKSIEINKSDSAISYRTKQRFDSKWYFLKMGISHSMTGEMKSLNRSNLNILNEIKILSVANHPNIVKYFTSWFEQRSFFIQLEYLIGESLYYFLYSSNKGVRNEFQMMPRTNKVSELGAMEIIKQIGSALSYLHDEQNVVHNDIQPSHILISHDQYSLLFKEDNVESVRSMIYQCLLGSRLPQNVKFKLTGFGYSFNLKEKARLHNADNLPPVINGPKPRDYWIKRDLYSLAVTVIHAINGANNFCLKKVIDNHYLGLDIRDESLRVMLISMMNKESDVSLRSLVKP